MADEISNLLKLVDETRGNIRSVNGKQIFSDSLLETLNVVSGKYFTEVRTTLNGLEGIESDVNKADVIFKGIHELSRKNCSKQKCLQAFKDARSLLVRLESALLTRTARQSLGARTTTDDAIIESLQDICEPAAMSYAQALRDLEVTDRLSWRGPATDLREALRETLDTLAPDKEVEAMPGYKHEHDAKRPTMKQKARYILRKRGYGSGQLAVPETAIEGVEEIVGGVVRSVYSRSSVSTHVVTNRDEVLRVHAWVRITLCELLALPM